MTIMRLEHKLLASEADALPIWHQPTKHHDKKMHIFLFPYDIIPSGGVPPEGY